MTSANLRRRVLSTVVGKGGIDCTCCSPGATAPTGRGPRRRRRKAMAIDSRLTRTHMRRDALVEVHDALAEETSP